MPLEIVRIPALSDNYIWLMHDDASGDTVVVDPGEAGPVLAAADARGWRIGQVWITHWHPDHTGGIAAIKAATGAVVTGPAAERARIPTLHVEVGPGDRLAIGGHDALVIDTPGHTAGHVSFYLPGEGIAFTGDALFAMGCGRLFEGTPADMHGGLQRLAALPDDTRVYCGHEYTLDNARFALAVDPDNAAVAERLAVVEARRAAGEATVPTSIGAERATNPFMRAADAAELGTLRAAKDRFAG